MTGHDPAPVDAPGGDPACWAHLLCPECQAVLEEPKAETCPRCGAQLAEPD